MDKRTLLEVFFSAFFFIPFYRAIPKPPIYPLGAWLFSLTKKNRFPMGVITFHSWAGSDLPTMVKREKKISRQIRWEIKGFGTYTLLGGKKI